MVIPTVVGKCIAVAGNGGGDGCGDVIRPAMFGVLVEWDSKGGADRAL